MNVLTLAIAILGGLLAFWLLGGVLLRIGGLLLALAGGFGVALQHDANGALVLAVGALLWLAGHWHYAVCHQAYKSPWPATSSPAGRRPGPTRPAGGRSPWDRASVSMASG